MIHAKYIENDGVGYKQINIYIDRVVLQLLQVQKCKNTYNIGQSVFASH